MGTAHCKRFLLVLALGALTGGAAALAATQLADRMPKLAPDRPMKGADSPGKVTFRHSSHVDDARPDCTVCHPGRWKILEAGQTADGQAISHKIMEAGGQCGSCHDGKKAFGLSEGCETCHEGS